MLIGGGSGGFYEGSSSDPRYNLSRIVQKSVEASKPVLGVSFNYRLSAFGFLWSDAVEAAGGDSNVGLRDQRLALHWIQENIAAFGGDPSKVTIWGESAGGIAIGRQLTAYGGRDDGLFRAAIMESGGPLERWPYATPDPTTYQNELYANLTNSTGCDGPQSLQCLRSLPFEDLNAALNITDTWIAGTGLGPWVSIVDGDFLLEDQSAAMKAGHFVKVPILYGTNTDEGTAIAPSGINTDEELREQIALGGPDNDTIAKIELLYPNIPAVGIPLGYELTSDDIATYGSQWKRASAFWGDMVEHMPRRYCVHEFASRNISAYSYRFDVLPAGLPLAISVTHYQEVSFVFNNIDGVGYATDPFNTSALELSSTVSADTLESQYDAISTLMSRMWVSFATDLNPNSHGLPGYPEWPAYQLVEGVGDNFVFEAAGPYVERDDWRAAGMEFMYAEAASQWKF